MTDENIETILNAYIKKEDKEYFCKFIDKETIEKNSYNLSVSSYVEQKDNREVINIDELNEEIKQIVIKQNELRKEIDEIVEDLEGVCDE